jgi:hypothetical protein
MAGPSCHRALDDPQPVALKLLDLEALSLHVIERLARHVIALESDRERIDELLDPAGDRLGAAHVLGEKEAAAGPQHPPHLGDRRGC